MATSGGAGGRLVVWMCRVPTLPLSRARCIAAVCLPCDGRGWCGCRVAAHHLTARLSGSSLLHGTCAARWAMSSVPSPLAHGQGDGVVLAWGGALGCGRPPSLCVGHWVVLVAAGWFLPWCPLGPGAFGERASAVGLDGVSSLSLPLRADACCAPFQALVLGWCCVGLRSSRGTPVSSRVVWCGCARLRRYRIANTLSVLALHFARLAACRCGHTPRRHSPWRLGALCAPPGSLVVQDVF